MKPIIIISGTSGIGKTLVSKTLFEKFNLDHRVTTGMIREVLKSENKKGNECLHNLTFKTKNPLKNFQDQSKRLKPAILACIERSKRENTSLILEGNHLTPGLYHEIKVDAFLVLTNNDQKLHRERMKGRDVKRTVNEKDFESIRKINDYLINQANKFNIPIINNQNLESTIKQICELISQFHNV